MKYSILSLIALVSILLQSCNEQQVEQEEAPNGFVRINATLQEYNVIQPWDRATPVNRRGLGAVLKDGKIITSSEMVANQVYLEIESADGVKKEPAKVIVIDREANLALLEPTREGDGDSFIDELKPLALSELLEPGNDVETWQLESNGQTTITHAKVNMVDILATYGGGKSFFSYLLKGSLQSAANSFTLPVLSKGKLAGILTSYDSDEQISEVVSSGVIEAFLADVNDGDYDGFPSLGLRGTSIKDQAFRDWLNLEEEDGGFFVTTVFADSAAKDAGLEVGDVILSVDDFKLDRKGYYDDDKFGKLSWTHLIRGKKKVGESVNLKINREGELKEISAELRKSPQRLVPTEYGEQGPKFYVKGGVVFQQLTKKYLQAYGKDWSSRAPLNLLDVYLQPENYREKMDEAVLLTKVIPSPITVGYEQVVNGFVENVNGVEIRKVADLEDGFAKSQNGTHVIQLSEAPYTIYLDAAACEQVDQALLQQGLPILKRIYE